MPLFGRIFSEVSFAGKMYLVLGTWVGCYDNMFKKRVV